ncbi:flagellar basal body rod protein [beta proteobacterium AAP51]|nr:flagellar basal body rod protein [beta proteobacterium AAP51]
MATNTATATDAAPPKGKKKLFIIIGAAVLVLVLALVAVLMLTKKPPEDAEEGGAAAKPKAAAAAKRDPKAPPVFVPLEPFTVNLADRDAERYAQVGITLEVTDAAVGEQMKVYMPAIRNNILMAISDKTAAELQTREGKDKLAGKVQRETSRALGYEVEEPEEETGDAEEEAPAKRKKKRRVEPVLPVTAVLFSNFIIQ